MTLRRIGIGIAIWFLLCRLIASFDNHFALIDAGVYAIGLYFVIVRRSRWWIILMACDWFIPFVIRIQSVTPAGLIWDTLYGICWTCGVVSVFREGEFHFGWTFLWRFRIWFDRFYYDGWHEVLSLGFVQIEYHH